MVGKTCLHFSAVRPEVGIYVYGPSEISRHGGDHIQESLEERYKPARDMA